MFNRQTVLEQAKKYDSFYLYDESVILEHTERLKRDFTGVEFLYSVKANPHPLVVKTVFSQGFGADAASLGEVLLSRQLGLPREKIYYSAPGKSAKDIREALDISVIVADSMGEILRIQEAAQERGAIAKIGIRINPDFTFYAQAGTASKFGINEGLLWENARQLKDLKNVEIIGIHVHLRSQELNAKALENYYKNMFALADRVQEKLGISLKFINLGSGLGIPYASTDAPLDTASLGEATARLIRKFKENVPEATVFIETGRFAVAKCGVYVTKVLDIKETYGKKFVILCNTLNGFIRPSLAQLIANYSADENPPGTEPLFTGRNAFDFIALTDETEREVVTLAGNLCTSADMVAKDMLLPRLKCGDVIVMTNAGSYAAALSPMQFSSQAPPAQLFLNRDGEVVGGS